MPSTSSPNKGYELMADGENIGTWGQKTNANLNIADLNLGGRQTLSLSTGTTTLNATGTNPSARNVIYLCGGALSGNCEIVYPAIGGVFVCSNATSNNFTVKFRSASEAPGGGTLIRQGATRVLYSDGASVKAADSQGDVPAGTAMLFAQALAPVGWTKALVNNDMGLRLVTGGTGGATGGTRPFLGDGTNTPTGGVFAITTTEGHALTVPELARHAHGSVDGSFRTTSGGSTHVVTDFSGGNNGVNGATAVAGGDVAHTHPLDLHLKYLDIIMATKD